jgi:hypothetical protein
MTQASARICLVEHQTGSSPMVFDYNTEPSGATLAAFRTSIRINGRVCTQSEFAAPVGHSAQNQSNYEREFNGTRMPLITWRLCLITWDQMMLRQWLETRPPHEGNKRKR